MFPRDQLPSLKSQIISQVRSTCFNKGYEEALRRGKKQFRHVPVHDRDCDTIMNQLFL